MSLLIIATAKGSGIIAEGEWDVKQRKQASLLTERFCIAAIAGVPIRLLPAKHHIHEKPLHQASKILN